MASVISVQLLVLGHLRKNNYVSCKVKEWVDDIMHLAAVASFQPHAAYAAFTHGLSSRWNYLSRIIPDIKHLLPLEKAIHQHLIPALTGREACSPTERELLSLPARLGGLGLINPATNSSEAFTASERITAPLAALIISQGSNQIPDCTQVQKIKRETKESKREMTEARARNISHFNPQQQRLMELVMEKGSSSWLTVLPLKEHGFHLHKGEFRNAISLRYGWSLSHTPQQCSCGTAFSVDHVMTCHMGGIPNIRHNEIRDLTASLVTEVCHNVSIEPLLQPLSGRVVLSPVGQYPTKCPSRYPCTWF